MRIYIKEIKSGGSEFTGKIPAELIDTSEHDDIVFVAPLRVIVWAEKAGQNVLAKIQIFGEMKGVCLRCLEDVSQEWTSQFLLDFSIHRGTEYIELDDDIRRESILGLPRKILCREDCQGLCSRCGGNKNNKECKCAQ